MAHAHTDDVQNSRESFRAAMTGFVVALVWLAVVSAAMVALASPSGEGHGPAKGAGSATEAAH